MSILEVSDVRKSFSKELQILKGISFSMEEGEVLSIIGSSGSGKSTLLRCLCLLETVDSGNISIDGKNLVTTVDGKATYVSKAAQHSLQLSMGLVFQNFNLFPHYSVLQNLTDAQIHVLGRSKNEATEKAMQLLETMNLADRAGAYPCQLSGGQQQRIAIARALALDPKILCFDEPTSALDPEFTGEVLKVIKSLKSTGRTMIIVTHEMGFAQHVSDKVLFMANGVIEESGTPEQIFKNPQSPILKSFLKKSLERI